RLAEEPSDEKPLKDTKDHKGNGRSISSFAQLRVLRSTFKSRVRSDRLPSFPQEGRDVEIILFVVSDHATSGTERNHFAASCRLCHRCSGSNCGVHWFWLGSESGVLLFRWLARQDERVLLFRITPTDNAVL